MGSFLSNQSRCKKYSHAKFVILSLVFHLFLLIAFVFFVQVAVGCIMSGYQISAEFSQYVIAASFLQPSINPVFFAVFLLEFREGYMALLHFVPEKIVRHCKGLLCVVTGRQLRCA